MGMMEDVIPGERANRDFRAKFPDDVMQDNLAGQLWFGAEVSWGYFLWYGWIIGFQSDENICSHLLAGHYADLLLLFCDGQKLVEYLNLNEDI